MKRLLLLSAGIMLFASTHTMAQISGSAGGTTKFTVGLSVGTTFLRGDLDKTNPAPAAKANVDYNFTRHISGGVEVQGGQLSEGTKEMNGEWYEGRKYTGTYFGFNVNGRVEAGQFTDNINNNILHALSGLYVGAGIGYVYSKAPSDIDREARGYVPFLAGTESAGMLTIPLNFGINIPVIKSETGVNKLLFNINYQYNNVFSDNLDSYNPVNTEYNKKKDAYSFITIGARLNIGETVWGE